MKALTNPMCVIFKVNLTKSHTEETTLLETSIFSDAYKAAVQCAVDNNLLNADAIEDPLDVSEDSKCHKHLKACMGDDFSVIAKGSDDEFPAVWIDAEIPWEDYR